MARIVPPDKPLYERSLAWLEDELDTYEALLDMDCTYAQRKAYQLEINEIQEIINLKKTWELIGINNECTTQQRNITKTSCIGEADPGDKETP